MAKITVKHAPDDNGYGEHEGVSVTITTNEGEKEVTFQHGEPEDMIIGRDLSDVWEISELLILAYNAGKAGEALEVEKLTVEHDEL